MKKISVKTFFCKSTSGQVATELITVCFMLYSVCNY